MISENALQTRSIQRHKEKMTKRPRLITKAMPTQTPQCPKKLKRHFKMLFLSSEVSSSSQLKVKRSPKVTSRSAIM